MSVQEGCFHIFDDVGSRIAELSYLIDRSCSLIIMGLRTHESDPTVPRDDQECLDSCGKVDMVLRNEDVIRSEAVLVGSSLDAFISVAVTSDVLARSNANLYTLLNKFTL